MEPFEESAGYMTGLYLRVAVPDSYYELTPVNMTGLIREWAAFLDPVQAVRDAASAFLGHPWVIGDRFVDGDFVPVERVRDAARDEPIVDSFKGAESELNLDGGGPPIASFVRETPEGVMLREDTMPFLLGLAALSAALHAVGHNGLVLARKMRAYEEKEAERAHAEWALQEEERQEEIRRVDEERGLR